MVVRSSTTSSLSSRENYPLTTIDQCIAHPFPELIRALKTKSGCNPCWVEEI